MFKRYDLAYKNSHNLGVVVHNAGQYIGITSGNSNGLTDPIKNLAFGDGSLFDPNNGEIDMRVMRFYQKMANFFFTLDLANKVSIYHGKKPKSKKLNGMKMGKKNLK